MKLKVILLSAAMIIWVAWEGFQYARLQRTGGYMRAAELSEGLAMSAQARAGVTEYFFQNDMLPRDNGDIGLPSPSRTAGKSVKRIAISQGGVINVDFDERIGHQSLTFLPKEGEYFGPLKWNCISDSIDAGVLSMLGSSCMFQAPTDANRLMKAIANSELDSVSELLAAGVQPNTVVNSNTPLMLSAKVGDVVIVQRLLDAGALVDKPADESEMHTPVMVAITNGHSEVVSLLLSRGASVSLEDNLGRTAMDYATGVDRRLGGDRFSRLVSARYHPKYVRVQDIATDRGNDELSIENPQQRRLHALYQQYIQALQSCHVQRLSSLLLGEGELDTSQVLQGEPLAKHIHLPQCVSVLHEYLRTKPSYQRAFHAYLDARIRNCDIRAVKSGLRDNPGLDFTRSYNGDTFIDIAVTAGCHAVLRLMVREQNLAGKLADDIILKALDHAPQERLVKLISSLLAARADVNGMDGQEREPLSAAISQEQPVIAKYLVDAGASVSKRTSGGSYPVIEATRKGYEHLVLQLLENGADLNARDSEGRTALFAAISRGQPRLVQSLITAGADTHSTDSNGVSAIRLAESLDLNSIRVLLMANNN